MQLLPLLLLFFFIFGIFTYVKYHFEKAGTTPKPTTETLKWQRIGTIRRNKYNNNKTKKNLENALSLFSTHNSFVMKMGFNFHLNIFFVCVVNIHRNAYIYSKGWPTKGRWFRNKIMNFFYWNIWFVRNFWVNFIKRWSLPTELLLILSFNEYLLSFHLKVFLAVEFNVRLCALNSSLPPPFMRPTTVSTTSYTHAHDDL